MKRRRLLAAALLAIPGLASAAGNRQGYGLPPGQMNTRWKIARFMLTAPVPGNSPGSNFNQDMIDTLREAGLGPRQHYEIVASHSVGRYADLPLFARKVVDANPDLILTYGTMAVKALRDETKTIPIFAAYMTDPVASGFAKSLARPGGNVTGIATLSEELVLKRLEYLLAIAPKARRVAYLSNPANFAEARCGPMVVAAARKMGREAVVFPVENGVRLKAAFDDFPRERIDAVLVGDDDVISRMTKMIGEHCQQARLPAFFAGAAPKEFRYIDARIDLKKPIVVPVAHHAVGGYAPDPSEQIPRLAQFARRFMKGEDVAEMPIEQPRKLELWFDPEAAQRIGLQIPPELRLRADKLID
jgi:putative ABC transport system substrate-binding protein